MHGLGSDLNLYAYVSGMALKAVDPIGLADEEPNAKAAEPMRVPFGPEGATPGTKFVIGEGPDRMVPADKFDKLADGRRVFIYDPTVELKPSDAKKLTDQEFTEAVRHIMQKLAGPTGQCTGLECAGVGERKKDTVGDQGMLALAFAVGTEPGKAGVSGGMAGGLGPEKNVSAKTQAAVGAGHLVVALLVGQVVKAYRAVKGMQEGLRALHAPSAPPPAPKVLQSGGNTIKKSTAKALGLTPGEARAAMHKLKPFVGAEPRDVGKNHVQW